MDSLLADELDRKANAETIREVAASSKRRLARAGGSDPSGADLYAEVVRQLKHWRPDIPERQIKDALLGKSLSAASDDDDVSLL